jgi:hypothetical protein
MVPNPITAKREAKEETGIDVTDLEMFGVDSGQELVFVGYTNSDVGFATDDTLKQFVRECFLSLNRMREKRINHREHRVHRGFLKVFLCDLCDLSGEKAFKKQSLMLLKEKENSQLLQMVFLSRASSDNTFETLKYAQHSVHWTGG